MSLECSCIHWTHFDEHGVLSPLYEVRVSGNGVVELLELLNISIGGSSTSSNDTGVDDVWVAVFANALNTSEWTVFDGLVREGS